MGGWSIGEFLVINTIFRLAQFETGTLKSVIGSVQKIIVNNKVDALGHMHMLELVDSGCRDVRTLTTVGMPKMVNM